MLTLSDLIIDARESLRAALRRMTQNHKGIIFVRDHDDHLVGVLSDGDARRTMLDDALLVVPICKIMNTDPVTACSVEEATDLIVRLSLVAVPVVDSNGRIIKAVVETGGSVEVLESADEVLGVDTLSVNSLGALAIIPARGGSKRVPRKNLARVAGRSLIDWAILAAKESNHIGPIIVSTDDDEIADASRALGVDVPWLRPADIAQDTSASIEVIMHSISWALKNLRPAPKWGVFLEPTAPLRSPEQIDKAVEMLVNSDADSVVSVSEVPHTLNPEELLQIEGGLLRRYLSAGMMDMRLQRNQQAPVYVQNGLVYAFRVESLTSLNSLYGHKTLPFITSWDLFLDVDTSADLRLADLKMSQLHGEDQIS